MAGSMSKEDAHGIQDLNKLKSQMQTSHDLLSNLLTGLYKDRIFPDFSVIRMQLRHMEEKGGCSFEDLVNVAQETPEEFKVEPDAETVSYMEKQIAGQNILLKRSIQFVKAPSWFEGWADTSDHCDPFPATLWMAFERYLENLARLVRNSTNISSAGAGCRQNGDLSEDGIAQVKNVEEKDMAKEADNTDVPSHAFRGGCYSMAVELEQRRLPFLQGRKLCEIYHIVKLGLHKGLLAYEDSLLVPTAVHSAARNVVSALPITSWRAPNEVPESPLVVQTHAELCDAVRKVLLDSPDGLDLSMLKVKIYETQNVRLNEHVFGCAKLLELVRLPALSSICAVERLPGRSAYRIVPRSASCRPTHQGPDSASVAPSAGRSPVPSTVPPSAQYSPWAGMALPHQSPPLPVSHRAPALLSTAPVAPSWPNMPANSFASPQEAFAPSRDVVDSVPPRRCMVGADIWSSHDPRANYSQPATVPGAASVAPMPGMPGMSGLHQPGCVDMDLCEDAAWRGHLTASRLPLAPNATNWGQFYPHWNQAGSGLAPGSMIDGSCYDLRAMGLVEASGFQADGTGVMDPEPHQPGMPGQLLLRTEPIQARRAEPHSGPLPHLLGSGRILSDIFAGSSTGDCSQDRVKTDGKWIDDMQPKASPTKKKNQLMVSHSLAAKKGEPAYIQLQEACF